MKYVRKQTIGKIQFIVESNFKNNTNVSTKKLLKTIMLNKSKECLQPISSAFVSQE